MEPREWRATQKRRVAAKHQAHQIFEDRFLDRIAVKFQRDAIEAVDVDEQHTDNAGLVVDPKRDCRRYRGWHRNRTLAHGACGIFHPAASVLQPGVVEGFFRERDASWRNVEGKRFRRRDFVVDVDFVEHRVADNAALMLTDRAVTEPRRLEHEAMTEVETVIDRGLEPIEVGDRLLEPSERLAHARIDVPETLDVGMLGRRLALRLVWSAQFVEQGGSIWHGDGSRLSRSEPRLHALGPETVVD